MGMGNFLWGRGGDGENFMGTILFTVSLSTVSVFAFKTCRLNGQF